MHPEENRYALYREAGAFLKEDSPVFAVIFEVNPWPEARDAYLGHAAVLRPEVLLIDGFISNERYSSLDRFGWLVSLSIWRDEKALIRWRTHPLHHEVQAKGRATIFADYHLRIGEIVVDTQAAEPLPQTRFDTTEVGAGKAVSITERPIGSARFPGADGFESLTSPGSGLYLRSWPDSESAKAGIGGEPGRHRVVRVIRDYGKTERTEAPQYFST